MTKLCTAGFFESTILEESHAMLEAIWALKIRSQITKYVVEALEKKSERNVTFQKNNVKAYVILRSSYS